MPETLYEHLYSEELYAIPGPSVTVVIPCAWQDLKEPEVNLLEKILGSVKLSPGKVCIVTAPVFEMDRAAEREASKYIVFGSAVRPEIACYKKTVQGKAMVVCADMLHQLDDAKKRSLWLALKELFGV